MNVFLFRLDDVEAKLLETEKEAEKARKDSKTAREQFNEIKRKRSVKFSFPHLCALIFETDASYSTKPTITYPSALIRFTKI